MSLSPMQEIFILLEDEKEVPMYRLNRWGKATRGVLGKLTKLKWAEKFQKEKEAYYRITKKGEKEFDKILKPLKTTGAWDGRWRLVIFDIPEKKRDVRDRLRRALNKLGLGILQASVWISPYNIKTEIDDIAKKLNVVENIRYFEVTRNKNLDKTIIEKSWNLPELSDLYKKFNTDVEQLKRSIDKMSNKNFAVKKLIYEYAQLLQQDPILPNEFRQENEVRKSACENYLYLRKQIN